MRREKDGWSVVEMATGYTELKVQATPKVFVDMEEPGDRYRNEIDYVALNKRFQIAATKIKTFPGADCGGNCDHVPVVAVVKLKLKKVKRAKKRVRKNWRLLKQKLVGKKNFNWN